MSGPAGGGDQRRRRERETEDKSGNLGLTAAAVGVGIGIIGYAATRIANNFFSAVPVANAANVLPTDSVDVAVVNGFASPPVYKPVCQCKHCDECKFLFSLKNYETVLKSGCVKADYLKQMVQYLCADLADLSDEESATCLQLAFRTKDCHVIQTVMAFWPAVFRTGLDSQIQAIDLELLSGDYPTPVHYVWKMVSDPSSWVADESYLTMEIPPELIYHNEPVPVVHVREPHPAKKGVRILTVDGGGTRGLILLELLANIEKLARKTIAESFDWVGGTSTGGIILLFLCLDNKRVEDCRKLYFRLKDEVFCGRKPYNSANFEKLLKEYFPPEKLMKDIDENKLKIGITTVTGTYNQLEMKLFTNYDSTRFTPIWEVARMTSAAPSYFQPYEFPAGSKKFYYDGGLMANNPTQDLCTELKVFDSLNNATVVSLGTGKYCLGEEVSINIDDSPFGALRMAWSGELKKLVDLLTNQVSKTDGEKILQMMTLATTAKCFYVRLTPTLPHKLELDETDNGRLVNAVWHTKAFAHVNKDVLNEVVARL